MLAAERAAWLGLIAAPGIGPRTARLLFSHFGPLDRIFDAGLSATARVRCAAPSRHDAVDLDTLAQRTGRDAADRVAALLKLKLTQDIEPLPGGRYQRLR